MKYLNLDMLQSIDASAFKNASPFPWVNPQGFLTEDGFEKLTGNMPALSLFEKSFGYARNYNQPSHDRYILEYQKDTPLPGPWQDLVKEIQGKEYRHLIKKMFGTRFFKIRLYWHYTPQKCAVSPHCDSSIKLGTQLFYMNTSADWDPQWGGQTVILDDNGKFERTSNHDFDDFDREIVAQTMGNRSFIFGRNGNSWHGVRPITAPEGKLRQVFIVVFEDANPLLVAKKRIKHLRNQLLRTAS